LAFLRWLIKTGENNTQILRLVLPILKALPGLLRQDRRWAASLQPLLCRLTKTDGKDEAEGGDAPR
jgi:hypothetical protein